MGSSSLVDAARAYDRFQAEGIVGLTFGLPEIDHMIRGIRPRELVVVAGRPGMGSTSVVLNLVVAALDEGRRVGVVTLEHSAGALASRLLKLRAERRRYAGLPVDDPYAWLEQARLEIVDTWGLSASDIDDHFRLADPERALDLLVVDPMKELRRPTDAPRGLKEIAGDRGVAVVAVASVTRRPESRRDKRLRLSDLRGARSIAEHADALLLLYREVYYDQDALEPDEMEISWVRHRASGITTYVRFDGASGAMHPSAWA